MPFHKRFSKINIFVPRPVKRPVKLQQKREDPIGQGIIEVANEVRLNQIQQADINKEMRDFKEDRTEVVAEKQDQNIKKRMLRLLSKLPKNDRLRNSMDEEREEAKSLPRNRLKLNDGRNVFLPRNRLKAF